MTKCRENADSARQVTYCILTPRNLILFSAAPTDVGPSRKHGELVLTNKVVDDSWQGGRSSDTNKLPDFLGVIVPCEEIFTSTLWKTSERRSQGVEECELSTRG